MGAVEKKRDSRSSATFKIGAVSLVFLIIGYQAAVFIHRSAILRIEAVRDSPDTVYIVRHTPERTERADGGREGAGGWADGSYARTEGSGKTGGSGKTEVSGGRADGSSAAASGEYGNAAGPERYDTIRRYADHSSAVRAVRERTRKVESFRFNPNEAPVEDLVRLGFSEKQAAAIDNYRKKGGRFRRKSDFAKSFVVSDSVFRRLEAFIDIPRTDINLADSAAFDALPGIGPYFAARMVEYRSRLGGYSYPEQLMDIRNFDPEKFEALKDLICCSPPQPYRLWTLEADSLRLHPYIGGWKEARAIVLLRENVAAEELGVEAIRQAGILSEENVGKLARCVIAEP